MNTAEQKSITIDFNTDGSTKIEANNFAGVGCKAATKALETLLTNGGAVDSKPKPDFYQSATGNNTLTN